MRDNLSGPAVLSSAKRAALIERRDGGMVDAGALKAPVLLGVGVRAPLSAQALKPLHNCWGFCFPTNVQNQPLNNSLHHIRDTHFRDTVVSKSLGAVFVTPYRPKIQASNPTTLKKTRTFSE